MSTSRTTIVLDVDPRDPAPEPIARAAALLRAGGLVAFPTETVYGLGANALEPDAIAGIYAAKGRPASDPLIVHIAAPAQLADVATELPPEALLLTKHFWPGPLTIVVQRHANIAPNVSAGTPTVAVRMPNHPVALALLRAAAVPVAAPSANLFARPSPTSAQHVLEDLRDRVDMVLDGGSTQIGLESTVISVLEAIPVILRPGGVPLEAIRAVLPHVRTREAYLAPDAAVASPGMLLKHYSPRADMLLFDGPLDAVLERMRAMAQEFGHSRRVGVLLPDEERSVFAGLPVRFESLGARDNLAGIGARLFAGMRALDSAGVDVIVTRGFGQTGVGAAIWDRLVRAAEGRIITVTP